MARWYVATVKPSGEEELVEEFIRFVQKPNKYCGTENIEEDYSVALFAFKYLDVLDYIHIIEETFREMNFTSSFTDDKGSKTWSVEYTDGVETFCIFESSVAPERIDKTFEEVTVIDDQCVEERQKERENREE